MLPGGIGVALLVLALVPGWLYLRLDQRLRPSSGATGLVELLEVLAVGLATTGTAGFIFVILPPRWAPFLLDLDTWARLGNDYLRENVRPAAASAFALLLVAVGVAYVLYLVQRLRSPAEFRAQGSVWVHALGARPQGRLPWVGLRLSDGKLIEGLLHSYSLAEGSAGDRDIALQRPIRITESDGGHPHDASIDRLIVPAREIAHIAVVHVPEGATR